MKMCVILDVVKSIVKKSWLSTFCAMFQKHVKEDPKQFGYNRDSLHDIKKYIWASRVLGALMEMPLYNEKTQTKLNYNIGSLCDVKKFVCAMQSSLYKDKTPKNLGYNMDSLRDVK